MPCAKRPFITSTAALLAVVAFLASVWMLPGMVQRLTYAAEAGQSLATREQLAKASDLSQAFQHVSCVMADDATCSSAARTE